MNYATFYIEGLITDPPRVDWVGGKLRITLYINDGSTDYNMAVYAYDPLASEMISKNLVPMIGDRVRLLLQLRVREDYFYAYLQDTRGIQIIETPDTRGKIR
jgi:hypothetical protein